MIDRHFSLDLFRYYELTADDLRRMTFWQRLRMYYRLDSGSGLLALYSAWRKARNPFSLKDVGRKVIYRSIGDVVVERGVIISVGDYIEVEWERTGRQKCLPKQIELE